MPIIKSAKKALNRGEFLREVNSKFKAQSKASIKSIKKEVSKLDKETPTKETLANLDVMLKKAQSDIDKAKRRNILNKNTAARKKSSLAKMVNNVKAK